MTDSEKLDLILSKMDQMESRMDRMESRMDQMEAKIDRMESRMDRMEAKIDRMESRMDQMESKIDRLESDIRNIELTIENEIRANIRQVAEGHHNLSRKLHEALKAGAENEMLSIRVNVLESEMRRVKEHLQIA
ncbi:hypothetical protein [uncultured Acetatifactor sp.]|uniref:hypothetical protein n=1 Tax=uncultured Acetatifactor sp. TaxID=1671927 RepID=UPI00272A16CE|nr:hypothetical protein [uncultured Acetatifactor sp.]